MAADRPWVLLPGWGLAGASLEPLKAALGDQRVTLLEWPEDPEIWRQAEAGQLDFLLSHLARQHLEPAIWLGWSLGGLVAARLAAHPQLGQLVEGLVTLGAGPWFQAGKDKPCSWGLNPAELKAFKRAFHKDPQATWQHFLSWQALGEPQPDAVVDQLEGLATGSTAQLHAGLTLLQQLDVQELILQPRLPWLLVRGEDDPLCEDWTELQARCPSRALTWVTLEGAGHAAQFSQPQRLAQRLLAWSHEL